MQEKIIFAAGYPIGFATINNDEYYSVQLNDKIYPINLLSAFIWLEALKGGRTKIDIMDGVLEELQKQGYELGKDFTLENLEISYSELLAISLLIEIGNKETYTLIENYPNITPFRVGFGLGTNFDKIVIHNESQNIDITNIEYYIWQLANGSRTLSAIYQEYENGYKLALSNNPNIDNEFTISSLKTVFADAFVNLYNKDLIYITNN